MNKNLLVGVLKSKSDLNILLASRWYRIPSEYFSKCKFEYMAFYQPASFGKRGKRIEYYARVLRKKKVKRIKLLPKESSHPRAHNDYVKLELAKIQKLPKPVRNIIPRRVSFGFTDLKTLLSAKNMLELFGVPATEQIIERHLKHAGIETIREYSVSDGGKRFRIDLAVFCKNGKIAIECDNKKAHSGKTQKQKDKLKDSFLRRRGWRVIRFNERDIIENTSLCVKNVTKAMKAAGKPGKLRTKHL